MLGGLVGNIPECGVAMDHSHASVDFDCKPHYLTGFIYEKLLKRTVSVLGKRGLVVNERYSERAICTCEEANAWEVQ